ncbi:hypothetical protein [Actinoplanes sp. NPDC023714]|uniref:hypothetical protein n=1 Tax=Actinoplanes sp. NPDC023714 TaxID=3154322 RepID=UPI0033D06D2B
MAMVVTAAVVAGLVGVVGFLLVSGTDPVETVVGEDAADRPVPMVAIVEPPTLGGRAPLTDDRFTAAAAVMEEGLAAYEDATNAFSAFYGKPESRDVVVVSAVARPVASADAALFGALRGLIKGGLAVEGIAPVDPGPLGGAAKCGDAVDADGVGIAVCGWADEGSLGVLMWYFSTADRATTEFVELRGKIETRTGPAPVAAAPSSGDEAICASFKEVQEAHLKRVLDSTLEQGARLDPAASRVVMVTFAEELAAVAAGSSGPVADAISTMSSEAEKIAADEDPTRALQTNTRYLRAAMEAQSACGQ